MIGAISRKEFADGETLEVLLYDVLAQSHFDYCCEVWDTWRWLSPEIAEASK